MTDSRVEREGISIWTALAHLIESPEFAYRVGTSPPALLLARWFGRRFFHESNVVRILGEFRIYLCVMYVLALVVGSVSDFLYFVLFCYHPLEARWRVCFQCLGLSVPCFSHRCCLRVMQQTLFLFFRCRTVTQIHHVTGTVNLHVDSCTATAIFTFVKGRIDLATETLQLILVVAGLPRLLDEVEGILLSAVNDEREGQKVGTIEYRREYVAIY